MKILIISDIHGNFHALDCVLKNIRHDVLVCCGDIVVDYPFPNQCIKVLRDHSAYACSGNNDYTIAHGQKASNFIGKKYAHLAADLDRAVELTIELISKESMKYIRELPRERRFALDGISFYMNHTAPRLSLHHYLDAGIPCTELDRFYQDIQADVLITGHTHIPYVNPGSVGEPRDGNPRASYATFETATGQIELGRLGYDTSETRQILIELGYPNYSLCCLENGFLPAAPAVSL